MKTSSATLWALCLVFISTLVLQTSSSPDVPQQAAPKQGFHQDLAWSPDGSKISFSWNGEGNFEIYVMQADGSAVTNLTHDPGSDRYATWSQDGKRLAFASDRSGKDKIDIYVMNADGSNVVRLTREAGPNSFPSWSKDGKRIVFMSKRDGHWQIYAMNADGSDQKRVTASEANDENPMFSPDSAHVIFESNRDGDHKDQLYSVKIDGSGLKRLTHDDANNVFPGWAPDGKSVIFGASRPTVPGDENNLYVMQEDGIGAKPLSTNGFFARWSPKGDRIAFIAGHYPATRILVMKADGSEAKQVSR